jgi:hypothetical protein
LTPALAVQRGFAIAAIMNKSTRGQVEHQTALRCQSMSYTGLPGNDWQLAYGSRGSARRRCRPAQRHRSVCPPLAVEELSYGTYDHSVDHEGNCKGGEL